MIGIVKKGSVVERKELETFDYNIGVDGSVEDVKKVDIVVDESYILKGEGIDIYDIAQSFMSFASNYGYDVNKSLDNIDSFIHSYYTGNDNSQFKKTLNSEYGKFCDIVCDELRTVILDKGCPIK